MSPVVSSDVTAWLGLEAVAKATASRASGLLVLDNCHEDTNEAHSSTLKY